MDSQICKDHEIQAHHIIKYRNSLNNEYDNIITLCNKCHVKIENGIIPCPNIF